MRIGDEPLTPTTLAAAARAERVEVELSAAARARMAAARRTAEAAMRSQAIYGVTTGVGANRHVAVEAGEEREHSLRLLRSHAGGIGEPLPEELVRGTIVVRLAQMAAGGGALRPELADALVALLRGGPLPVLHDLGGVGTGDLTILGQLGLALTEPKGGLTPFKFEAGDAIALMSSNAATFAAAALAWSDLAELLDGGLGVAALTFRALDGNREAFAEPVAVLPGEVAVARRLRALTEGASQPARIQDPFALRCLPQVAGALHTALAALHELLAIEMNAAAENPLIAGEEILHHGGFHAAGCALALDTLRLALVPFAELSLARLSHLMSPDLTGLTWFLAADAPGSSGMMIAEYLAADAVARLRADAAPAVHGSVTLSRGLEEHASFAWQSAGHARRAVGHLRSVLALEWVAAERALRMKGVPSPFAAQFDDRIEDRPIAADAGLAEAQLPALATIARGRCSPPPSCGEEPAEPPPHAGGSAPAVT
jgi:histidine ammonia-lyase